LKISLPEEEEEKSKQNNLLFEEEGGAKAQWAQSGVDHEMRLFQPHSSQNLNQIWFIF
jgi:hypothetical protein